MLTNHHGLQWRWLCWCFYWAWRHRMGNRADWGVKKVVKVTGWRSALVDRWGVGREHWEFVMPWESV